MRIPKLNKTNQELYNKIEAIIKRHGYITRGHLNQIKADQLNARPEVQGKRWLELDNNLSGFNTRTIRLTLEKNGYKKYRTNSGRSFWIDILHDFNTDVEYQYGPGYFSATK